MVVFHLTSPAGNRNHKGIDVGGGGGGKIRRNGSSELNAIRWMTGRKQSRISLSGMVTIGGLAICCKNCIHLIEWP